MLKIARTLNGNEKQFDFAGVEVIDVNKMLNLPCLYLFITSY